MRVLRWTLGIVSVVTGLGWLALAGLGSIFRGSFGASPVELATQAGPPVVAALVLTSLALPGSRVLLHATAIILALSGCGLVFLLRESLILGTAGLAYCGAWFAFYARTLPSHAGSQPSRPQNFPPGSPRA